MIALAPTRALWQRALGGWSRVSACAAIVFLAAIAPGCSTTQGAPAAGGDAGAVQARSTPTAAADASCQDACAAPSRAGDSPPRPVAESGTSEANVVDAGGDLAPEAGGASIADSGPTDAGSRVEAGPAGPLQVMVFSATAGYRHASIPDGIAALKLLATQNGWVVTATEDSTQFQDSTLSGFDVLVFLSTTGDVLDTDQQGALIRYIQAGKGWVGIHSASDTEHDWAWYGGLVGAYFSSHPDVQQASIRVEDSTFPATKGLPNPWVRTDEWYAFTSNPRGRVNVLLSLDESSYSPGDSGMNGDHPIAWYQTYEGGRSFYTALGHTSESYQEPLFVAHLAAAIGWAGGR